MKVRLLAALVALGWGVASAAEGSGGYAGAFLRMGLAPRAQAMGDAYVAVPQGAYVGLYNPAGVALLPGPEFAVAAGALTLDRSLFVVGFSLPVRPKGHGAMDGGVGFTWIHAGVDNIDGRDSDGMPIGTFSNSENAFALTFAVRPHRVLTVGLTGAILYNRLPGVTRENGALTSSGVGLTAGAMLTPWRGLTVGVALHNINAKYTWNTEKVYERGTAVTDRFPVSLRMGASYRLGEDKMLASVELEQNEKLGTLYRLGIEAAIAKQLALRGGLNNGRLRVGVGFIFPVLGHRAGLDYAYLASVEGLGADHMFGWVFYL
ncbi:MAG: hypothetical protein ONB17_10525 [candidate division KSB1 bacterium]|nr:hypothetical protein [candidate division KSB1 bacterium]MDZ7377771.1 hypothetical protein [candidate division KSB1 bacterium]